MGLNSYLLKATVKKSQLAYSPWKLIGCIFKCFSESSFLEIQDLPKAGWVRKANMQQSGGQWISDGSWMAWEIPLPVRAHLRLRLMTGISETSEIGQKSWLVKRSQKDAQPPHFQHHPNISREPWPTPPLIGSMIGIQHQKEWTLPHPGTLPFRVFSAWETNIRRGSL